MTIKVILNGAQGKMGQTVLNSIHQETDLTLVATTGREDNLKTAIQKYQPDVAIDFTTPTAVFKNTNTIIDNNVRPVIGTTGLNTQEIRALTDRCQRKKLGGIIAPNFSLSAVLLMKYAQHAAQYFSDAEIIELHHPQKKDQPSGTAKKTAAIIEQAHAAHARNQNNLQISHRKIPIHSVRLPGLLSHQMVIFTNSHEILSFRQDNLSRHSFMPGLFLACRKVMSMCSLTQGLEKLL